MTQIETVPDQEQDPGIRRDRVAIAVGLVALSTFGGYRLANFIENEENTAAMNSAENLSTCLEYLEQLGSSPEGIVEVDSDSASPECDLEPREDIYVPGYADIDRIAYTVSIAEVEAWLQEALEEAEDFNTFQRNVAWIFSGTLVSMGSLVGFERYFNWTDQKERRQSK